MLLIHASLWFSGILAIQIRALYFESQQHSSPEELRGSPLPRGALPSANTLRESRMLTNSKVTTNVLWEMSRL